MRNVSILSVCFLMFGLSTGSCQVLKKSKKHDKENVGVDSVKKDNLIEKLNEFAKEEIKPDSATVARLDSLDKNFPIVKKDIYTIAVLMPFALDIKDQSANQKKSAGVAIDYYKGILAATDSIKKMGLNLNLQVIDYEKSGSKLWRIRDSLKAMNVDLVLGPLVEDDIKKSVGFFDANKINMVSPIRSLDTVAKLSHYIELNTTQDVYADYVLKMYNDSFKGYKVIVVNEKSVEKDPTAKHFLEKVVADSMKIIDFKGKSSASYKPKLGISKKNFVLITSKSESFVSGVLSQIRKFNAEDTQIVVIGNYAWRHFATYEGEMWETFRLTLLDPFYVDYENKQVKKFIRHYRNEYNDEPTEWAFRGYDDMIFLSAMLKKYGVNFQRTFPEETVKTLHTTYRMNKSPKSGAYVNTYLNVLKFQNYSLKKINE